MHLNQSIRLGKILHKGAARQDLARSKSLLLLVSLHDQPGHGSSRSAEVSPTIAIVMPPLPARATSKAPAAPSLGEVALRSQAKRKQMV